MPFFALSFSWRMARLPKIIIGDHWQRLPDVVAAAVVVSSLGFTNKLKGMDPQSPMRINGNGMSTIIISKYWLECI